MNRSLFSNAVFMVITIIVITGFQAYWLKDNYDREKKALQIKTNLAFQETVHKLQAVKLKLPDPFTDSSEHGEQTRIFLDDDNMASGDSFPRRKIIAMVNTIREKMQDERKGNRLVKTSAVFRLRRVPKDSLPESITKLTDTSNHLLNVLYRVDSLQDSIRVGEIAASYAGMLKQENIGVGYKVLRLPVSEARYETDMSKAVVGFAHPITYQLVLTDTWTYLFRKISLPVLFSLLLIATTLFSFFILYRNLLRQRRLTDMKNEFISNISHELKTPIATVGVAIEALKNFHALDDAQKTKEYLDISSSELQRLGLLVDKVLKLSVFEKHQTQLNKELFDLKKLVEEVLGAMKPQFEKQEAVVGFITEGDDFTVHADKLHLTSVLYNLIDNALKYSTGAPFIDLSLTRHKDIFKLKVSDKGIGIAREYKSKVFDKFFRVPTGNRHVVKGYGLGLSYVSEIIKRHLGFIEVESEPGRGSSFTVSIPVEEKDVIWFDEKRCVRKVKLHLPALKKA